MTMDNIYGQHGWREFFRNRRDILNKYDQILNQTTNRPIRTAHGVGVEAELRSWLTEFLPKKYAVCSGYIIPDVYEEITLYHFDIIVYDALESPILWTEGNADESSQGRSLAIPAKYVRAVFEVKSRLTTNNIKDSFEKLNQVADFKTQFHQNFACYSIFIELKKADIKRWSILKELSQGPNVFGYAGGLVLRNEEDIHSSGRIKYQLMTEPEEEDSVANKRAKKMPLAKAIDSLNIYASEDGSASIAEAGGGIQAVKTCSTNWSVSKFYNACYQNTPTRLILSWSNTNFSLFWMDFLNQLDGTNKTGENNISFGRVFDKLKTKGTIRQSKKQKSGKPFLKFYCTQDDVTRKWYETTVKDAVITLTYRIVVENKGSTDVTFWMEEDKKRCELEAGAKATSERQVIITLDPLKNDANSLDIVEGMRIPHRLLYMNEHKSGKNIYSIESVFVFEHSKISVEIN